MNEFIFKQEFAKEPSALFIKMSARKPSTELKRTYKALVDTGAQISGISEELVNDLALTKVKEVPMVDANGNTIMRPTFKVDLIIPGSPQEYCFLDVEVPLAGSTQGEKILLGMNILNKGSFCFDTLEDKYIMTFKIKDI